MFFTNLMIFDFSCSKTKCFIRNIFAIGMEAASLWWWHEVAERSGAIRVPPP